MKKQLLPIIALMSITLGSCGQNTLKAPHQLAKGERVTVMEWEAAFTKAMNEPKFFKDNYNDEGNLDKDKVTSSTTTSYDYKKVEHVRTNPAGSKLKESLETEKLDKWTLDTKIAKALQYETVEMTVAKGPAYKKDEKTSNKLYAMNDGNDVIMLDTANKVKDRTKDMNIFDAYAVLTSVSFASVGFVFAATDLACQGKSFEADEYIDYEFYNRKDKVFTMVYEEELKADNFDTGAVSIHGTAVSTVQYVIKDKEITYSQAIEYKDASYKESEDGPTIKVNQKEYKVVSVNHGFASFAKPLSSKGYVEK